MKLTVHIGTTKTGSTSIQAFMRVNRKALAAKGISYPAMLGVQDHRNAAIAVLNFTQGQDLLKRKEIMTPEDLQTFSSGIATSFREVFNAKPEPTEHVVISSEHLQSRCNKPENIERFREIFATGFAEVKIVVYVRPQLDQLVSLYSTTLRNGASETMQEHIERHMSDRLFTYFDLEGIVKRWSAVFGEDNIVVRPYKAVPPQAKGGVVADFCRLLNFRHDDPALRSPPKTNSSINARGQELLRIINSNGGVDPERLRLMIDWAEANCSGKGAVPDLAQAQAFQQRFDAGNTWIIDQYFPRHPEYLEPHWPKA